MIGMGNERVRGGDESGPVAASAVALARRRLVRKGWSLGAGRSRLAPAQVLAERGGQARLAHSGGRCRRRRIAGGCRRGCRRGCRWYWRHAYCLAREVPAGQGGIPPSRLVFMQGVWHEAAIRAWASCRSVGVAHVLGKDGVVGSIPTGSTSGFPRGRSAAEIRPPDRGFRHDAVPAVPAGRTAACWMRIRPSSRTGNGSRGWMLPKHDGRSIFAEPCGMRHRGRAEDRMTWPTVADRKDWPG